MSKRRSSFPEKKVDYYEELGVSYEASREHIRHAFLRLVKLHHPDRTSSRDSADRFLKIQTAYAVLSNETRRREYDWKTRGVLRHNQSPVKPEESSSFERKSPQQFSSNIEQTVSAGTGPERYSQSYLSQVASAERHKNVAYRKQVDAQMKVMTDKTEQSRCDWYKQARENYNAKVQVDREDETNKDRQQNSTNNKPERISGNALKRYLTKFWKSLAPSSWTGFTRSIFFPFIFFIKDQQTGGDDAAE